VFPKEAPTRGAAKGVLISGMRHFGCITQNKALAKILFIYLFIFIFLYFSSFMGKKKR